MPLRNGDIPGQFMKMCSDEMTHRVNTEREKPLRTHCRLNIACTRRDDSGGDTGRIRAA